jgi:hypothetical protein
VTVRFEPATRELPPGHIFDIARAAGIVVPERGDKRRIKCPLHGDRNASAFLSSKNIFFCSVCTPEGGWPAKRFAEELRLDWSRFRPESRPWRSHEAEEDPNPFTPTDAAATWQRALARARDDDAVDAERRVYAYLADRHLTESFELGVLGILATTPDLHPRLVSWYERSYRIIAALLSQRGLIANVQARAIDRGRTPKTMVAKGSRVSGTVFADRRGQWLLRGEADDPVVVLGEGLTDMLALSIASPFPVITAPGTSNAVASIGPWVKGRHILLALDRDLAAEMQVKSVAHAIHEHGGRGVRRVIWPGTAKDACDVGAERGWPALTEFLEREGGKVSS